MSERKKLKERARRMKLPNKMLVFKNKDKKNHEKWKPGRNYGNFPSPFRWLIIGRPNSGKSMMVANMMLRFRPPFESIYLHHPDPDTMEYNEYDIIRLNRFPEMEDFEGFEGGEEGEEDGEFKINPKSKKLLIIDDIEFSDMKKDDLKQMDYLFRYISTHKNFSLILCQQQLTKVPKILRTCCNIITIFKPIDVSDLSCISRKMGFTPNKFIELFDKCKDDSDSITFDFTKESPAPVRFNIWEKITREI